ncbi:uncharacterized protein LOC124500516 [Dermatophagoides farinae]|uniref:Uncharacterized protein n=1 Tax=Dermatophagoides farinae TaxID=6954 RepID=A0A922KS69_DERFA|nr:uncharacterized protein LOC124500516 [Dermatophagoides farinae]KAH7639962.1 hypothetical protein HUG17_3995 [Dermatophagoides farinae]KAH9493288.1 hypothetical protein DERF_014047 [Dermatophagoides farinae]
MNTDRPIGFAIDDIDRSQHQQVNIENIRLTWIDRIWRFFYSKEEFEAYLIEKELKKQKKRERKLAREQQAQMQS